MCLGNFDLFVRLPLMEVLPFFKTSLMCFFDLSALINLSYFFILTHKNRRHHSVHMPHLD